MKSKTVSLYSPTALLPEHCIELGTDVCGTTEHVLDCANNCVLYINVNHDTVYFRQPVDWPAWITTEHERTRYVTTFPGMVDQGLPTRPNRLYCVYREQNHVFMYDDCPGNQTLEQYVYSEAAGRILIEQCPFEYTVHDTLQSAFDRARFFAKLILRLQLQGVQPLREFPNF